MKATKLFGVTIILRTVGVILVFLDVGLSWVAILGAVLIGVSFVLQTDVRVEPQVNSSARLFAVYATLFSFGAVLMMVGISWITFLGLALVLLSLFFSSARSSGSRNLLPLVICLAGSIFQLVCSIRTGDILARTPPKMWYVFLICGVWICCLLSEYLQWPRSRFGR